VTGRYAVDVDLIRLGSRSARLTWRSSRDLLNDNDARVIRVACSIRGGRWFRTAGVNRRLAVTTRPLPYDRRSMMRKTLGLVAAGLLAVFGVALAAAPAGVTYAATAIEYGLIA
jgi:hypothetical protein